MHTPLTMKGGKGLTCACLLLISSSLFVLGAYGYPPITQGLSLGHYKSICPEVESIIQKQLKKVFKKDIGQAAGLLRIHFHDCFVQGCDGSLLLTGTTSTPSEQVAPPNQNIRAEGLRIINDLRRRIHDKCGVTVSCSDIAALAARDSVSMSGGPYYDIPLGRRDGLTIASEAVVLTDLPAPIANASSILSDLAKKGFNPTDVVALSGAHTIGLSHCISILNRLFPTPDPTMDKTLNRNLLKLCPTLASLNSTNTTFMDIRTPNLFDNKYFVGLLNRQGFFTSDQDLYTDRRTRPIVTRFAVNQTQFFESFVEGMIKMSQLSVLTGTQGEIRANCSRTNPTRSYLASVVDMDNEVDSSPEFS